MSARTIWKGSIQASILNIPVKVYGAINASNGVHFNQLCPDCKGRIKQSIGCPTCQKELSRDQVLKGYAVAKDQFVIMSEEEIDSAHKDKTETISIVNFIGSGEIDPIYYEDAYYLTPEKAGYDLFQLFVESLIETKKNALAKIVMRSKEHLVLLAPYQKILIGYGLHYPEDLRTVKDIPDSDFPQKTIDPEMIKLAKQLIGNLAGSFDPSLYKDEYREIILKHVEAKAQGIVIAPEPKREIQKQVNLMDALKQAVSATAQAQA
jgi:DNA end-binding protein Ku